MGSAFQKASAFAELNAIASRPPQEHIFRVDNFDALRDIQRQLKEKIFAIEGKSERGLALDTSFMGAFPLGPALWT